MDVPENQPPVKKRRRRTAYVLRLQQEARELRRERLMALGKLGLTLVIFSGLIYLLLSLTSAPGRMTSRASVPSKSPR